MVVFVGTTSVILNVKLVGPGGNIIFDQQIKKAKRGDADSLSLTGDIAKDISKRIDKVVTKLQVAQPI